MSREIYMQGMNDAKNDIGPTNDSPDYMQGYNAGWESRGYSCGMRQESIPASLASVPAAAQAAFMKSYTQLWPTWEAGRTPAKFDPNYDYMQNSPSARRRQAWYRSRARGR